MPTVEVYLKDDDNPLFVGDFGFLPRPGEHIAKDAGGYFIYYDVIEVWHRDTGTAGVFQACVQVELND